jgi:hypothetical protein
MIVATYPAAVLCCADAPFESVDAGALIVTDEGLVVTHGDGTADAYPLGEYLLITRPTPSLN